jgi:hypothetical protein
MDGGEPSGSVDLSPAETARVRERVSLMLEISSRSYRFRRGILDAARRLTPHEAAIVADLERNGLDVTQLRDLLHGAHVLVDQPELYERWVFPHKSHQRMSSHHPEIDKRTYPDYGMRGPLVREKLHGRTAHGTWLQLEKTPATMTAGKIKLPSLTDLKHLADYVVYRVTRSNVGPWGRSGATERRPMYLSPDLGVRVPIPKKVSDELTGVISEIEESDDVTSVSDMAYRFPPPDRANDLAELTFTGIAQGRGLFGGASVWSTPSSSDKAAELLRNQVQRPAWSVPEPGKTSQSTLQVGDRTLTYAIRLGASQEAPA